MYKSYKIRLLPTKEQEELIGKTFNRLTIVSLDKIVRSQPYYRCICECGNIKVIRYDALKSGKTKSCGCLLKETNSTKAKNMHKFKDKDFYIKKAKEHIGEIFNKLKIIDVIKNNKYIYMVCKCECGIISNKMYADLKSGKVKSCGCYQKEQASKTGSIVGLNNFKSKYKWYFVKNDKKISCRSGYEVIYANYLIDKNIEFDYEPETFKLANGKRYTPDFYLINTDEYIEIKGSFKANENSHQKENIDIFKTNYSIVIMYWNDIVEKCDLSYKSYNTYLQQAKKLKIKEEDYLNKI